MSKVITQLIHQTNHTRFNKLAVLSSNNIDEQSIISISYRNDNIYHLNIGVYKIEINNINYIFHLYIPTIDNDSTLYIKSPTNAYVEIHNKKFNILLYKVLGTQNTNIESLDYTLNNYIDLIIVNGYSDSIVVDSLALEDLGFYYPINENYQILSYNPTLDQMSEDSIILNNFDFIHIIPTNISPSQNDNIFLLSETSSIMNEDTNESLRSVDIYSQNNLDENYNYIDNIDFIESNNSPINVENSNNVRIIKSIDKIELETYNENKNNSIVLELKKYIKSLPNSIHDTLIINAEQQICQTIHRISKKIFLGNDNWNYVSSNNKTVLFSLSDNNIKQEDSNSIYYNMRCSHFVCNKCNILIDEDYKVTGISSMCGNYGNGIFVRVPIEIIDMDDKINSFNNWIRDELYNGRMFIIEYELSQPIYKTYLLDEYHVKTFYPITNINNINNYDISYGYKSLIPRGGL